jgi:two-component system response regulator HydG
MIKPDETINVLLVGQSADFIRPVLEILALKAIRGIVTANPETAPDYLDKNDCRLVFIEADAAMKSEAFELVSKIKTAYPEMPIVMVVQKQRNESPEERYLIEMAVSAMRIGCFDFLVGPLGREKIELLIETIIPNKPVNAVDSAQENAGCIYKIVGKSPLLIQTVSLARKVAPTSAPVLISGESGTGKELISYVVHYNSRRSEGPFVKVNCAALSETLLESELFGHEKGAFTGAYTQRKGRFEAAHGGTLLLDEISETPLRFQAKLLRALEQQDFQRVGSNENVKVDVRVISTTNKDLSQEVADGNFRQDLYYRLCGVRLAVAPLRQRKEDLPDLVWHFVNFYAGQAHRRISRLDPAMMELFSKYHWPGNVRQLRNVILTSMIMGIGETMTLADVSWLFDELQPLPEIERQITDLQTSVLHPVSSDSLAGMPLEQLERQAILETLKQTNGNQTRAAKALGISDRTLRDKIKRYRQTLMPV